MQLVHAASRVPASTTEDAQPADASKIETSTVAAAAATVAERDHGGTEQVRTLKCIKRKRKREGEMQDGMK